MKLILRFLKPHWKLFLLTVFLLIVDVAGALIIPTLASEMLQEGEMGVEMQVLINTASVMATTAVISGAGGIFSGYACAELVSRIAKDIRDANCILFMEQGNIIEQGTHKELLAKGGAYAALYNSQFA